jgi:hypothetical protein
LCIIFLGSTKGKKNNNNNVSLTCHIVKQELESEARVVTGGGDGWVNYQGKELKQNFLS